MKLGYHPITQNYGYYIDKAPQNVLEELGQQINALQSDFSKGEKINDLLAGEIHHEYRIRPQFITQQYIRNLTEFFENTCGYIDLNYKVTPKLQFDILWVNFQQKYEYNPIHDHTGVFSFVIWYQIPYTLKDEQKFSSNHKQECHNGTFHFVMPNIFGSKSHIATQVIPIDKTTEGHIAIFPSSLNHMVYPFYSSDEYRITIAGNIVNINDMP